MHRFLALLLLTLAFHAVFSQLRTSPSLWRLTIADSATHKGIERATITFGKKQFITDANGVTDIEGSVVNLKDP